MTTAISIRARGALGAALLLVTAWLPAAAQSGVASQVELGTFGVFTKYDSSNLGLGDEFGAGGRLGFFLTNTIFLEASGDYTETHTSLLNRRVTATRIGGTLFANAPILKSSGFYMGAGYERIFYRAARNFADNGIHVVMGPRLSVGGRAAVRIEGRATYLPSSNAPAATGSAFNFSATAGLSVFSFGGKPRDSDLDGVRNSGDDCPDTPVGATVDAAGCPGDSDTDLVYNGLDQCPGTPGGADVDTVGCPSDADEDGIFNGIDICPDTPAGAVADENGCPTDEDSDAVFDGIDQCPATPAGAIVDPTGCPSDEDADGVFDGIDQCAGTPAGLLVDDVGCPTDDDQDGVYNDLDQCPDTPPNTEVDERGCIPDSDTDGDGVVDRIDACPGTPAGTSVDEIGCPILFVTDEATQRVQPLVLQGVNFATGRSRLTSESFAVLNMVAASLLAHPEVRVEVAGHTDITGRRSTNMRLSVGRAQAVLQYLAQQGIDVSQMTAQGYGPDQPIATNSTAAGRAANRRVELRRIDQ